MILFLFQVSRPINSPSYKPCIINWVSDTIPLRQRGKAKGLLSNRAPSSLTSNKYSLIKFHMGHRLSKQQRMLPKTAKPNNSVTNAIDSSSCNSGDTKIAPIPTPSVVNAPTSVIITIRMLKMEPNDTTTNAVRQPSCLCLPSSTTTTAVTTNDIVSGNCIHCRCQTNNLNDSSHQRHHVPNPIIGLAREQLTDDENDDDDNSNILIGQFSQFNNNYESSDDEEYARKYDYKNRGCAVTVDSIANMNSLNLQSKPNVVCDNLNHISSEFCSALDSAAMNGSPLVGCKELENINKSMISATNYKKTINGNNALTAGSALQQSVAQAIAAAAAKAACELNLNNNNQSVQQAENNSLYESDAARHLESSG